MSSNIMPLRIALLDDHEVVRQGYVSEIQKDSSLRVEASFESSRSLIAALWNGLVIDLLVLDYSLGSKEVDGVNLIGMLKAKRPDLKILVASAYNTSATVSLVLRAGVNGFLGKEQPLAEILNAIRRIAQGEQYLSIDMRLRLSGVPFGNETININSKDSKLAFLFKGISLREREVLRCFMEGMSVSEIAEKFSRSIKTISNQKQAAFKKLGIRTVADLINVRKQIEGS